MYVFFLQWTAEKSSVLIYKYNYLTNEDPRQAAIEPSYYK